MDSSSPFISSMMISQSVVVMEKQEWCVVVFECRPDYVQNVLVDFYEFVENLKGIEDLHFLIRDRLDDYVIFSFRILMKAEDKKTLKSKIKYKLSSIIPEKKFVIDPSEENALYKYVAWNYKERIDKLGQERFDVFCNFLGQLSRVVVDMAKKGCFGSVERVEMAHVASWMLGCTEYSILTTIHMEMGYYDRIEDRYQPYQKQSLGK